MGTFSTETDIANSALIKLGRDLVTSIDDDNESARVCKARLPFVRDEVMRSHTWNFATKRVALAKTLNTPVYDYTNEFQLPSDVLRVITTNLIDFPFGSDKTVTTTFGVASPPWVIEGDKLLANDSEVKILYIFRQTDISKWTSDFGEVCAFRLAVDLCYRLTQNTALLKELKADFKHQLALARAFDAQEKGPDSVSTTDWIDARI